MTLPPGSQRILKRPQGSPSESPELSFVPKIAPSDKSTTIAQIASEFTGIYAKVARRLEVSPSLVSRVAHGHRFSPKVDNALREELKAFREKLDKHL